MCFYRFKVKGAYMRKILIKGSKSARHTKKNNVESCKNQHMTAAERRIHLHAQFFALTLSLSDAFEG